MDVIYINKRFWEKFSLPYLLGVVCEDGFLLPPLVDIVLRQDLRGPNCIKPGEENHFTKTLKCSRKEFTSDSTLAQTA